MNVQYDVATRQTLDLTEHPSIERAITNQYKWVINCAAWTDVDGAEVKEHQATDVNGTGVGWLANRCKSVGATLVHYSTDYVFSGVASEPYPTDTPHAPVNAYGRSKAVGERLIVESGVRHLLVRTSWLYAPWGNNFVRTMVRLARERTEIRVVDDQRGRPTSAEHLASMSLALMERGAAAKGLAGVFHVTDGDECSWFEFAQAIVGTRCVVRSCSSTEFPRPAQRPAYSVLALDKTEARIGSLQPWREAVTNVLAQCDVS
jgi:dTDP-4-dehydrorhamnose reductase